MDLLDGGSQKEFDEAIDVYGGLKIGATSKTVEDLLGGAAPEPVASPEPAPLLQESPAAPLTESTPTPSPIEKPAPSTEQKFTEFSLGSKIEIKPSHFENVIDSSKVEGSDSVWKSSRELFMQNRHQMDYDASKDWPPSEWADKKTAELVKEYADAHGGQAPELVHDGDKVVVETGADGKYHLKVVSSSGQEVEPRALPRQESSPVSYEEKPEAPALSEADKPQIKEVKMDPAAERLAREYQALPMDSTRDEFVYNYIAAEIEKPAYRNLKLPHMNEEKLIAFARMFSGGDWAQISSPEKLARTLVEFDASMKFYTRKLVDGSLDKIFKDCGERALELTHNVFPVEAQDGEILYAQMQKGGKWRIAASNGDPIELKRPIMRKTDLFDLKNVKKLLGYKSFENMTDLPTESELKEVPAPSESEIEKPELAERPAAVQKGIAGEIIEKRQNQEIPVDIAIGEGSFQGKVEVTPSGAVRFEGNAARIDPSKILRENWRGLVIEKIGGKRDLNLSMSAIEMNARNIIIEQEIAKAIASEKPFEAAALRKAAQRQIEQLEKIYGDVFK